MHKADGRRYLCGALLALAAGLAGVSPAPAEHANIDLSVTARDGDAHAVTDEEPPEGGVIERPILQVRVDEPLVMQFFFTNIYPHGVVKGVTVRYYVVRIDELGQKETPSLEYGEVVVEGAVNMNFKPDCRVGARLRFRISEPGNYRVRVDSLNTASDHEHFAAIDIEAR